MKRFGLVLLIAAVAAGGIYYGSHRAPSTPHATVTTLLPATTLAFGHLPDFERTHDEWRESDVYKLYQEPAVQDFLKPLRIPQKDGTSDTLKEIERLEPKDAILAMTPNETNKP